MVSSPPSSGTGGKRDDKWLFISSINKRFDSWWMRLCFVSFYLQLPWKGTSFMKSSRFGCSGPKLGWMKSAIPALAVKLKCITNISISKRSKFEVQESNIPKSQIDTLTNFTWIRKWEGRWVYCWEQCVSCPAVIVNAHQILITGGWWPVKYIDFANLFEQHSALVWFGLFRCHSIWSFP